MSKFIPKPATWGKKRTGKVPKYKYLTISEIYSESCTHSSQVNVYGIVCDFKEVTKSRGTDYFCIVQIIDPTSQKPLKIRLFSREKSFLPVVKRGNVIRFHRLKVYKSTKTDVILLSSAHWSWVIWEANDVLNQGRAVSDTFTVLFSDKEKVQELKDWLSENPLNIVTNTMCEPKRISDINPGDYVQLVCMVVAYKKVSDDQLIAKVCDGTLPNHKFFSFEQFPDSEVENCFHGLPKCYVINVTIFDNFVGEWFDRMIGEKDFITLFNLHAWPNPNHPDNVGKHLKKCECSELTLHGGTRYNSRISKSVEGADDFLEQVQNDVDLLQLFTADDREKGRCENLDHSPKPSNGRKSSEISPQNRHKKLKLSDISDDIPCSSNMERNNNATCLDNSFVEMMHKDIEKRLEKSLTAVTGENLPAELSTLKEITEAELEIGSSKSFRVRLHINECLVDPENYVVHFCPPTGLFVPANNSGEPLQLPDKVFDFVNAWRQVRDMDSASSEDNDLDLSEISETQWDIPGDTGHPNTAVMKHYYHIADGSMWQSFEGKEHVVRKRKLGSEVFTIVYVLKESEDYSPSELTNLELSYNRVVRVLPLSLLKSQNPPAVAYQDGVYYYCSPEYAVQPRLPSLKYEAEWFTEDKVIHAMGSPTYFVSFMLFFGVHDVTGEIEKLCLKQEDAEAFFLGITAQKFLLNSDESSTAVRKFVRSLVEKQPCIECIVEKQSLESASNDKESIPMYLMRNTRIIAPGKK